MPFDTFEVDYIIRAECVKRKDSSLIWAYSVKWKSDGYFNYSREDENHVCFKHDSTLLQDFWTSTGVSPDDYYYAGAVIEPPRSYINRCKSKPQSQPISSELPTDDIIILESPPRPSASGTNVVGSGKAPVEVISLIDSDDDVPPIEILPNPDDTDSMDDCDSLFGDTLYGNPQEPAALLVPRPTGDELLALAGYCREGAEALPDFEDDASMDIVENSLPATVPSPIVDKALHVPALMDIVENPLPPTMPSHIVGKDLHVPQPALPATPPPTNHQVTVMQLDDMSLPDDPFTPKVPGFNLILNSQALPLTLKDVSWTIVHPLFSSVEDVPVHGFYFHRDLCAALVEWRGKETWETAKVCLREPGVTRQHREQLQLLHKTLFNKELCLIAFIPNTPDTSEPPDTPNALVVFSSQNKPFGKAIGACKRRLGWINTVIACIAKIPCPVPFKKNDEDLM